MVRSSSLPRHETHSLRGAVLIFPKGAAGGLDPCPPLPFLNMDAHTAGIWAAMVIVTGIYLFMCVMALVAWSIERREERERNKL